MVQLDKINELLALAMKNLTNNNNPSVQKKETMNVEDALAVAKLGKVAVETYKVKLQALKLVSSPESVEDTRRVLFDSGILTDGDNKLKNLKR